MASFAFADCPDPVRPDLGAAYRRAWEHVARPGTWLSGAERVAVAEETRRALACAVCAERRDALSPAMIGGAHDSSGRLAEPMVDAVHRVTTDAARLSEKWYRSLLEAGLDAERYVEALGVAVITISVDRFHHALGVPLEPLPEPVPGEPSRERPADVVEGEAWVPMQSAKAAAKLVGLPGGRAPYVLRALTLVPDELRAWRDVAGAQYLDEKEMLRFDSSRALSRAQIELVAGRVSALNECFY